MRIEVRLCETLGRRRGCAFSVTVRDGATVGDALVRLRLRSDGYRLALINGRNLLSESGNLDGARPLADGDHLVLGAAAEAERSFRQPFHAFMQRLSSLLSPLAQTP